MRKNIIYTSYIRLIFLSLLVGLSGSLLAKSLEVLTAFVQEFLFHAGKNRSWLYLVLPWIGISLIYFSRKYLFKGKKNKGIREIFTTLRWRKDHLPAYKIPSHFINGFFTVAFGGSTGIEVSTVVATAAIGNSAFRKRTIANAYKEELICAGVAAGIGTLFGNPLAGFLFALEVISRKRSISVVISCLVAILVSWSLMPLFGSEKLFDITVLYWKYGALPYMIVLSLLAGLVAVYFTRSVIYLKNISEFLKNDFLRVSLGTLLLGMGIYFFPQLYGDSYHAVLELLQAGSEDAIIMDLLYLLFFLVLLKPVAASVTLAAGGDGGVFAPSIVAGAFLGILVAVACNHFLGTELVIANFALIGSAAVLSAAIHAPLTALFLVCGSVNNGFVLFVPLAVAVFTAKFLAKNLCSYTVYTFKKNKNTSLSNA